MITSKPNILIKLINKKALIIVFSLFTFYSLNAQSINATQTIGTEIFETEEWKAENKAKYFANEMDWQGLYTSGHWAEDISSWINIHTKVLNDSFRFTDDFKKISERIEDPSQYKDFVEKVAFYLREQSKNNYINKIASLVRLSGKITNYEGILASYIKGAPGTQAPDLIIKDNDKTFILKNNKLAVGNYSKTMLLFYASGCQPCEDLLKQLPNYYENINNKGVKIISMSADEDEKVFKAKDFLWKDSYCDYEGVRGANFQNYAIIGTPTIFLLDNTGKILLRTASLEEILGYLKIE